MGGSSSGITPSNFQQKLEAAEAIRGNKGVTPEYKQAALAALQAATISAKDIANYKDRIEVLREDLHSESSGGKLYAAACKVESFTQGVIGRPVSLGSQVYMARHTTKESIAKQKVELQNELTKVSTKEAPLVASFSAKDIPSGKSEIECDPMRDIKPPDIPPGGYKESVGRILDAVDKKLKKDIAELKAKIPLDTKELTRLEGLQKESEAMRKGLEKIPPKKSPGLVKDLKVMITQRSVYEKGLESIRRDLKAGLVIYIGSPKGSSDGPREIRVPKGASEQEVSEAMTEIEEAIQETFGKGLPLESACKIVSCLHLGANPENPPGMRGRINGLEQKGGSFTPNQKSISLYSDGNFSLSVRGDVHSNYSKKMASGGFKGNREVLDRVSDKEESYHLHNSKAGQEEVSRVGGYVFNVTGNLKSVNRQVVSLPISEEVNPYFNDWNGREGALQKAIDALPSVREGLEVVRVGLDADSFFKKSEDNNFDALKEDLQTRGLLFEDKNLELSDPPDYSEVLSFQEKVEKFIGKIQEIKERDSSSFPDLDNRWLREKRNELNAISSGMKRNQPPTRDQIQKLNALKKELEPLTKLDKTPIYRRAIAQNVGQSLKDFERDYEYHIGGVSLHQDSLQAELNSLNEGGRKALAKEMSSFYQSDSGKDIIGTEFDPIRGFLRDEAKKAYKFVEKERYENMSKSLALRKESEIVPPLTEEEKEYIKRLDSLASSSILLEYAKSINYEMPIALASKKQAMIDSIKDPGQTAKIEDFFKKQAMIDLLRDSKHTAGIESFLKKHDEAAMTFLTSEEFKDANKFLSGKKYQNYLAFGKSKKAGDNTKAQQLADSFSEKEKRYIGSMKSLKGSIFKMRLSQAIEGTFDCSSTKDIEKKAKAVSLLHQGFLARPTEEVIAQGGEVIPGSLGKVKISIDKAGDVTSAFQFDICSKYAKNVAQGSYGFEEEVASSLSREEKNFSDRISSKELMEQVASMGTFILTERVNVFKNTFSLEVDPVQVNPHFKKWDEVLRSAE